MEELEETDVVNLLQDEMKYSSQRFLDKTNQSLQITNSFLTHCSKILMKYGKKAEKKLEDQRKIGGDSKKK